MAIRNPARALYIYENERGFVHLHHAKTITTRFELAEAGFYDRPSATDQRPRFILICTNPARALYVYKRECDDLIYTAPKQVST